ncbi:predicted protein [Aspergillus terreus NIH2624]|uniref:Uncharacterized protein n=1 Tax=Aspergillus terreus (strain NIH 2624 / FGSC A1156) TaxID=341663 RepID=Q0C9K7_ASPTN|nr:uncharacterized protein ATEG_09627 [Aspergillus terreus NIH2624]EAU29818.1 predicted protein [Aspergillus terreus NIH2624]
MGRYLGRLVLQLQLMSSRTALLYQFEPLFAHKPMAKAKSIGPQISTRLLSVLVSATGGSGERIDVTTFESPWIIQPARCTLETIPHTLEELLHHYHSEGSDLAIYRCEARDDVGSKPAIRTDTVDALARMNLLPQDTYATVGQHRGVESIGAFLRSHRSVGCLPFQKNCFFQARGCRHVCVGKTS